MMTVRILLNFAALILIGAGITFTSSNAQRLTHAQALHNAAALSIDVHGDAPLGFVFGQAEGQCHPRESHGFPLPDAGCTPGAANPTVTLEVLTNPTFKTSFVRDMATTRVQKEATYEWYGVEKPDHNFGRSQICELDHLVSLELGGSDTLDNIWPQCGPDRVTLNERYFKQKDAVENYLAWQVRAGAIDLHAAQFGIAQDWTQYLEAALEWQRQRHGRRRVAKGR